MEANRRTGTLTSHLAGLKAALVLAGLLLIPAAGAQTISRAAPSGPRILYASDWTGTMEIFAADPSGRAVGQLTFARPEGTCHSPTACGYLRPQPSPDGRWLAYWSTARFPGERSTLWLARADGKRPRRIGDGSNAAWRPDSRVLAYSAADGIHFLTVGGGNRIAVRSPTGGLGWFSDGKTLAFTTGSVIGFYGGGHLSSLVPPGAGGDEILAFALSPDGRVLAYSTHAGVFVVGLGEGRLNGRRVYKSSVSWPGCLSGVDTSQSELAFSPNGRLLAFTLGGTPGVVETHGWRARTFHDQGHDLSWSPDGRSLLLVHGCADSSNDRMTGGEMHSISLSGRIRTLVSTSRPYGGQIVSAAWTTPPRSVHYRRTQAVTGFFAGGPVQKLAADADRVAFASCGRLSVWTAGSGTNVPLEGALTECYSTYTRAAHVGSLAIAGNRVLWWYADLGLGFRWRMRTATIGAQPINLADGSGNLGGTPTYGTGTAVGNGSLLAMSSWRLDYTRGNAVAQQSIERVDAGGCPCPEISGTPGPYTPLDVDQGRIVVSGTNETRVLGGDGDVLLSVAIPTLAAQLSGSRLVLAAGKHLQVYDVGTGALMATWALPASPVGHDCDLYADPSCNYGTPPSQVVLEDVGHGLAVYMYAGQVHVLRLSDGVDSTLAFGTLARFVTDGLVYADGARIWLTPYDRLPVQSTT